MKRSLVLLNSDLLKAALHFPEGTEIIGAEWHLPTNSVVLCVTQDALPDMPDGHQAPYVSLRIKAEWR